MGARKPESPYDRAMVERDPAFLWETAALRSESPGRRPPLEEAVPATPHREDWHTLRQASEITAIPIPTIRKWALGGYVPSFLDETPVGPLRMVSLKGVYRRAGELGREVRGAPPAAEEAEPPAAGRGTGSPRSSVPPDAETPPGTMLVPLDAWNRMLNQLGNLHEAGQQLAEARERAAKAETEVRFLRERLAQMRGDAIVEGSDPSPSGPDTPPRPLPTRTVLGRLYSGWRQRKGRG